MLWDRKTGQPVHHAIVWQDRRAEPTCARLREDGMSRHDPRQDRPGDRRLLFGHQAQAGCWTTCRARGQQAERGELAFGTVDSWLMWQLTGGKAACHRRQQRLAHACCSTCTATPGTTSCWRCWTFPRRSCPQVRPSSAHFARHACRACSAPPIADRRRGRRPAERAVRPGLLQGRHGEEHLRHRLLPADAHRRHVPALAQRPADHQRGAGRRRDRVRDRRQRVRRRRGGAVAARRPARPSRAAAKCRRWPKACPIPAA